MEHVEIAMRSSITYHLAHECGAFAYTDAAKLPGFADHEDWLERVRGEIERSDEAFIGHFNARYTGALPLWMASEVMSFGALAKLFACLPPVVRQKVAQSVGVHQSVVVNWLYVIHKSRNRCAHHARIWNAELPVYPKIPRKETKWAGLRPNGLFVLLLILRQVLRAVGRGDNWAKSGSRR